MILAEEDPTDGTVFFESINVHQLKSKDLTKLRRRIGVVFQDYKLLPNKTAYEILLLHGSCRKTEEEIASDVPHVLELVDLSHRISHFPNKCLEVSSTSRIARAIINQPELIIADEPQEFGSSQHARDSADFKENK